MNIRKLLNLLNYLTAVLFIYLLSYADPRFISYAIFTIATQLIIELLYFTYEYFMHYRSGEVVIIKTRDSWTNPESLVSGVLFAIVAVLFFYRVDVFDLDSDTGFLLGALGTCLLYTSPSPRDS